LKGITLRHFLPFATVILLPGMLDAQGKLVKFGDSGLGDLAWLFYIVLAAMILVPAFYLIKSRSSASGPSKATKQKRPRLPRVSNSGQRPWASPWAHPGPWNESPCA